MKIGILSDTHDRHGRTRRALDCLVGAGALALIHCGDITGAEVIELCAAALPITFVLGNNDSDSVPELKRVAADTGAVCLGLGGVIELAGKKVAVTHGHLSSEVRRALAAGPDYLLSGHSHVPADRREGAVRRINPGALHRTEELSVAVLDLESDELRFLAVPRKRR